jgi:Arc/MetJ-type ribon-helix-helix transcriptional regulator
LKKAEDGKNRMPRVLPTAAGGITLKCMNTISLKLPEPLIREVETEARRRGVSKSELIRSTLESSLRRKRGKKRVSCLDLMGDLVGSQPGPADASTNPRYLEEAIEEDYNRGRKNSR